MNENSVNFLGTLKIEEVLFKIKSLDSVNEFIVVFRSEDFINELVKFYEIVGKYSRQQYYSTT